MTVDWKKKLIPNLPYLLFVYLFDKLCQAVRLAPGLDASEKFLHLSQGFTEAFSSGLPSLHPLDLLAGIAGAVIVRLAVYAKSKNTKKYRKGIEYGSARWGTAADIAPYVDPVPDWNIPLTQTEKLTMSSRPKNPKYARNKNILVIGGSGSGKTRFFVKPSLMQMHSSYVVTDPKGQLLSEVGTMLRRGAPKLDENGKPLRDARGKVIYEPYRIKVLNTINFKKSMKYNPFGYTAKQTLDYAQSLYEKKLLTYPRTDSRYLTGDMAETASVVLHLAARVTPFDACPEFFPDVLALVNDKEVSDHHAILPTLELEKANVPGLPVGERNILLLVCCKLLCAAAEPFVYEAVTATFDCGGHTFTAKGKQVLSQGWRAIQEVFRSSLKEKPEDEDAEGVLPALTEGQVFEPVSASVTEHFTSPPKPYTEDTLLSAMENAGKEDMPDEAERKGLGTPATRAAIIEKLVSGGFVERKGKNLIPTKAGVNLVTVLPELLTSPKLTADWEQRLNEVAKGQASPEDFMDGIEAMAAELVRKYSHISEDGQKLFQPEKETVGLCPRCGKPVYEGKKNFACSDRACQFVMWKNDRFWTSRRKEMTRKMAADLLKKGHTSVKGMWSEKKGSTYDAVVILDDTGGKYVNFKLEFPKRKDGVHGKK